MYSFFYFILNGDFAISKYCENLLGAKNNSYIRVHCRRPHHRGASGHTPLDLIAKKLVIGPKRKEREKDFPL